MVDLQRMRVALDGFPGGPGVSTMYFTDAGAALPEIKGMWAEFLAHMPVAVQATYPSSGDIIDPMDGKLTGAWTAAAPAGDVGVLTGSYSAPSGAVITWLTGGVLDGTRLRGRTFVVPLGAGSYGPDGTLDDGVRASLQATATGKIGTMAGNLKIWHRPRTKATPRKPVHGGGFSTVTSAVVHDRVAVLRSRRA